MRPDGWSGIKRTTVAQPGCIQPGSIHVSEDCMTQVIFESSSNLSFSGLYLNVWSPVDAVNLPVMVYIHGGNLETGSGGDYFYDGENLALATKAVLLQRLSIPFFNSLQVVVTISYRLGALGFLHTEGIEGQFGSMNDEMSSLQLRFCFRHL
jgi:para-nitrobenzyl esterase